MADRIPVVADDRERRSGVVDALHTSGDFDVTVQRLAIGDYLVDERFLFERKTLPDLALSIQSGRLFRQALRLAQVPRLRPALILEGTSARSTRLRHGVGGDPGCASDHRAVCGAPGIAHPVARRNRANLALRGTPGACRRAGRVATAGSPAERQGRSPETPVTKGLPGVGPARAARLLERFGMDEQKLLERITVNPGIFMRISVELILSLLAQGETPEAILADYPDLEAEDIRACLAYAHAVIAHDRLDAVRVVRG